MLQKGNEDLDEYILNMLSKVSKSNEAYVKTCRIELTTVAKGFKASSNRSLTYFGLQNMTF